jgi:hypothetical protein
MNAAFDPVLPDRVVCGGQPASPVEPVASNVTALQSNDFCTSHGEPTPLGATCTQARAAGSP